jgi:hypothetical protein
MIRQGGNLVAEKRSCDPKTGQGRIDPIWMILL